MNNDVDQKKMVNATIIEVQNMTDYFAKFNATEQIHYYIFTGNVPTSIFDYDFEGKANSWFILIWMILTAFVICFTQNCGHLLQKRLVMANSCSGGSSTTLIKRSLLALCIITSTFAGIYFIINTRFDEYMTKEKAMYSVNKTLWNTVIGYNNEKQFDDLQWSLDYVYTHFYEDFKNEEKFRKGEFGDLLSDSDKTLDLFINNKLRLIEKGKSLKEKSFNMPLVNDNKRIKLDIYDSIGDPETKDFIFNSTVESYDRLSAKWYEIKKQVSQESFFSNPSSSKIPMSGTESKENKLPANPEMKETDDGQEFTPSTAMEDFNFKVTKFQEYYNDRKGFVVEAGYQIRNARMFVEKYYEDKSDLFESYDSLNWFCFLVCITCSGASVAIVAFRWTKLRIVLILLWVPVLLMSLCLTYKSISLMAFGGMIYTGCQDFTNFTQSFEFNSSKVEPFYLFKNRTEIEAKVNHSTNLDRFKERVMSCGKGGETLFNENLFTKMSDDKIDFASWWFDHRSEMVVPIEDFESQNIEKYLLDLQTYVNFSAFDSNNPDDEGYEESPLFAMDTLSSVTSYEFLRKDNNSIQYKKGNCSISKDQWVLSESHCYSPYKFQSNESLSTTDFATLDLNSPSCFSIFDWSQEQISSRYSNSSFSSCNNQTIGEVNITYADFMIKLHSQVQDFAISLNESIHRNVNFFKDLKNNSDVIKSHLIMLNKSIEVEDDFVEDISQGLFIFNQSNNCSFIKESFFNVSRDFCYAEQINTDTYFQSFSILAVISFFLGLILGGLGCGFYNNPIDVEDYRELEMETIENFTTGNGRISYVSMHSMMND